MSVSLFFVVNLGDNLGDILGDDLGDNLGDNLGDDLGLFRDALDLEVVVLEPDLILATPALQVLPHGALRRRVDRAKGRHLLLLRELEQV